MKILNLYAGIGGNRKLWGDEHEIMAVEYKEDIANVYRDFFPKDTVIVADAHEYLLKHYAEFDFIWSSPPCPTHSIARKATILDPYKDNTAQLANGGGHEPAYPAMELYQEILLLQNFFRGKWCVENVIAYYEPLIAPIEMATHWFWANFAITRLPREARGHHQNIENAQKLKGFDMSKFRNVDKRKLLRNAVEPFTGKHILDCAIKSPSLFQEKTEEIKMPLF